MGQKSCRCPVERLPIATALVLGLLCSCSLSALPSQPTRSLELATASQPSAPGSSVLAAPRRAARDRPVYTPEAIEDFMASAFGNEFATVPDTLYLRRWERPLRIEVLGRPNEIDRATLNRIISELNALIAQVRGERNPVSLQIAAPNTPPKEINAQIYFIPREEFAAVEPGYVEGNMGFFYVWWNRRLEITRSRILISTTGLTQAARSHLIREELTQSLGLMNDSWRDRASTFYQGWTETQDFTDRDRQMIQLLYDPRLRLGMNEAQVRAVLAAPLP